MRAYNFARAVLVPGLLGFLALASVACSRPAESGAGAASPAPSSPATPLPAPTPAPSSPVRLATTTSVHDSGLLASLLPVFEQETGLRVVVTAVGTGQAFQIGRDGNADLLLVHDRKGEEQFVAEGHGASRHEFMWNTFEILGPADDPAGIAGSTTGAAAFAKIAASGAPFVSRGDDSGTHRRETSLWKASGAKPAEGQVSSTGQGMGATLRVADEKNAYVLCDQGTRLGYKTPLRIQAHVAGTDDLKNRYAVVRIAKAKHPEADTASGDRLADWLLSPATAKRIEAFQVGGQPLFRSVSSGQ